MEKFKVVYGDGITFNYDLAVFSTIGPAVDFAWRCVHRDGLPANYVDVLKLNHHGNYESIWFSTSREATDEKASEKIIFSRVGGPGK